MQKRIFKVAIIGGCCTRDAFNKMFIPNWREYFDVVLYKFQTSFISMCACPVPYSRKMIPSRNERTFWDNFFIDECTKDYYNQLVSVNPEFLIIDFYSDVYNGVVGINGYSYITDRTGKWDKIPAFEMLDVGEKESIRIEYYSYMNKWRKAFDSFMEFVKNYLPQTKLIINSVRFRREVLTSNGEIYDINRPEIDIDLLNKAWEEMDNYAIENYGIRAIDYNGKKYYLDPDYVFGGKWICHFHNDFHKDLFNKLIEICNSYPEQNVKAKVRGSNVLLNGSFELGTLFWKYWEEKFNIKKKVTENGTVKICTFTQVEDNGKKFNQCWSNDIEVDTDTEYTLSFWCKVTQSELLQTNNIIFAIRVFEKKGLQTAKESVQNILIKYSAEISVDNDGFGRYICSFIPKGRYVSVGPCIHQKGIVEWKDICFCHSDSKCDILKSVSEDILLDEQDVLVDVNKQLITNIKQLLL